MRFIDKYLPNRNIKLFLLRTVIFFAIFFGLNYFIFFYFRHTGFFINYLKIPDMFYIPFLTGLEKYRFVNSALFIVVIFLIFTWKRLERLKLDRFSPKEGLIYGASTILFLVLHYFLKYLIKINLDFALEHTLFFTLLKYLINILMTVSLALAIFGYSYIKRFIINFWKEMIVFSVLLVFFYFLIDLFGLIWFPLSIFVSRVLVFILGLSFSDVILDYPVAGEAPTLGVKDFVVGVSKDCSGIDSLLLYLGLFLFLVVLNWKDIDKKRMAIIFIPGLIGTIIYNILRVYLLMLTGVFISPEFAIDAFHSNVGWILFLLYFFVFWHYGSKYVFRK